MVSFGLYNLKGGVGKTASTINLAYLAAKDGYKTLVWDIDPQGSTSFYLGVESNIKNEGKKILGGDADIETSVRPTIYENLFCIPADLSLRNADVLLAEGKASKKKLSALLSKLKTSFDVIFIDCPPGISLIHDNIFNAADWLLMPNIPTTLSINSFNTVQQYFTEQELDTSKLKCFFSMVDHRKNLHHQTMQSFYKHKVFFKNYIPNLSDVEKMGTELAPVETYAYSSYAAQCYRDLWKEIKKTCVE